ncbi:MAG: hypothetical protein ACRDSZ_07350 [Pseudonocardiaceae bacterium]
MPDFAPDAGRHCKRLSMLSAMPHTTTSPFQRSNPDAIPSTDHASSGATYQTNYDLLLAALRDALLDMVGSARPTRYRPGGVRSWLWAGRYVALCGVEVLAASLTEAPRGHCRSCAPVPGQRSRSNR